MTTDGTGTIHEALPKLNTLLLEEVINWAIESDNATYDLVGKGRRRLAVLNGVPKWGQETWGSFSNKMREQSENYCGTSFCIAGKALQDTGNLTFANPDVPGVFMQDPQITPTVIGFNETLENVGGVEFHAAGAAVLGLTSEESIKLFNGSNTIRQVVNTAMRIAESRGETLDLVSFYVEPVPPAA